MGRGENTCILKWAKVLKDNKCIFIFDSLPIQIIKGQS